MIYTFITAIVFIALIATGAAFLIYGFVQKAKNTGKRIIPVAVPAAMIAVGLILVILIPGSFHTVEAGSVALVKQLGVIVDVEQPGTYFDFYLTRKYEEYDVKVQQVEIQTEAYTADAQSMDISMVLQFQIDSAKVEEIAVNYGSLEALTNRIQSVAVERTKATLSQYQAEKLIEERDRVSPKVQTVINEEMQKKEYCVTFNSTVLTDITFSEAFEAAVEAKMMAQQEKLQAQYENEKKKEQAEAALYVAEQEAKALVAKAQAEADAQVRDIGELPRLREIFEIAFDEMEGRDEKLQMLAAKVAVKLRHDSFVRSVLLDYEGDDVVKIHILHELVLRNEDDSFGTVVCNLYKEFFTHKIEIGARKETEFLNAFADVYSKFALLGEENEHKICAAAEDVYATLEEYEAWD